MDEQNFDGQEIPAETETTAYRPRPRYQVILARVGVVIMVVAFLLYCWQIAFGAP